MPLGWIPGADETILAANTLSDNALQGKVVTHAQGLFLEAVGTFILMTTVFMTAVRPSNMDKDTSSEEALAPLPIGISIFVVHTVLIPFTNCGINPARSFGPALVSNTWDDHWVFWLGPAMGAFMSTLIWNVLLKPSTSEATSRQRRSEVLAKSVNDVAGVSV